MDVDFEKCEQLASDFTSTLNTKRFLLTVCQVLGLSSQRVTDLQIKISEKMKEDLLHVISASDNPLAKIHHMALYTSSDIQRISRSSRATLQTNLAPLENGNVEAYIEQAAQIFSGIVVSGIQQEFNGIIEVEPISIQKVTKQRPASAPRHSKPSY